MIEAVCLVDADSLTVITANQAACQLLERDLFAMIGQPVLELLRAPEDAFFWSDVAAGQSDHIRSDTLVVTSSGRSVQVERRVSQLRSEGEQRFFVVCLRDQTEERRVEAELEKLVAELRATLESTADGILVTDLEGSIRGYNRHFAQLWNLPQELLTRRDDAAVFEWMSQAAAEHEHYDRRLSLIRESPLLEVNDVLTLRTGRVLERVTLPQYARGRSIGRVYSFRDITQRLTDEARLKLAAKVFETSLDAVFIGDPQWRVVAVNPNAERLTGRASSELLGRQFEDLVHDQQDEGVFERVQRQLSSDGLWIGELWHRRGDGVLIPGQASMVRVPDDQGGTLHHVLFFRDVTEKLAAKRRIEQLAYTDVLTGLPNRQRLVERLDMMLALARRSDLVFAVAFIDLDRFKQINDSLGHQFGDRVLIEVAERIQSCLRDADTLARIGGDEFVMLLHQADMQGAEVVGRRVLAALAEPFELEGLSFSVTCSMGVALYPTDGETRDDLIKHADTAMYRVKERGRAGLRFYQPQMNVDLLARMKLDHAMRQGLEQGEFKLCYQPQVRLSDSAIVGAEALLRWNSASLGAVTPSQFIPVAEESGFIVALGDWVLVQAVAQAARWQAAGQPTRVSVNVSALQFQQANFIERVAHVLDAAGLPHDLIELELTESILINDVNEALSRLEALARLGVGLAIDDFGTGYSSLGYLKRFPIRHLKIDRTFVTGLPGDRSDSGIVQAIVTLGQSLGLSVVAEGVETQVQLDFLQQLGCEEYQGFLFAPALEVEAFERLLIENRTAGTKPQTV